MTGLTSRSSCSCFHHFLKSQPSTNNLLPLKPILLNLDLVLLLAMRCSLLLLFFMQISDRALLCTARPTNMPPLSTCMLFNGSKRSPRSDVSSLVNGSSLVMDAASLHRITCLRPLLQLCLVASNGSLVALAGAAHGTALTKHQKLTSLHRQAGRKRGATEFICT